MSSEKLEMKKFKFKDEGVTLFTYNGESFYLSQLFNMDCGFCGQEKGPYQTKGMLLLDTDEGRYSNNLELVECVNKENRLHIIWQTPDSGLQIKSRWTFDESTGVWSRKDILKNIGDKEIKINRYLARFTFSPANYEVYTQQSRWDNENQGRWQELHHKQIRQSCKEGRSCEGSTPILGLRDKTENRGVVFHVIPQGDWFISASTHPIRDSLPFVVIEAGISDENLRIVLKKNQSFAAPEILFHELSCGQIHLGAHKLHQYINENVFKSSIKEPPVVYNTWFDDFEHLKLDRLRSQLDAAKRAGCEVFVIDAGWFGADDGHWSEQIGNWQEKQESAFFGKMKDFADEVRETGLGFGLWMEPERVSPKTPIYQEHSEWFICNRNGFYYHDLSNPEVYTYLLSEISRLVETYELAWMKVDFNFDFGYDPSGLEFYNYYKKWYMILDELQKRYEDVFFEGCASGGLRTDINTMSHFDGHFLSDTVNPYDVLRIYQGAVLRLPPGRITKWVVLRAIGQVIPSYVKPVDSSPEAVITAGSANWENSFNAPIDFIIRAAFPGIIGLSGDIASLQDNFLERLRFNINFYKEWREFITGSVLYLLTPPRPKNDQKGWVAFQLQKPGSQDSLLFVYRLKSYCDSKKFFLQGMKTEDKYQIVNVDSPENSYVKAGADLKREGIRVDIANENNALILKILCK